MQAEQRPDAKSGFGNGHKVTLPFAEFVRRVEQGDSSLYITTQYPTEGEPHEESDDGDGVATSKESSSSAASSGSSGSSSVGDLRYLLAPPLTALLGDFPLHPPLFASLIPHQFNLWFGHAQRRTSSRLHHDFHCNLYVLLRGHKHITLVSPRHTHRMQLSGRVRLVHANGLICYHQDAMHEDASTDSERRQERKSQLEAAIAALETDVQRMADERASRAAAEAKRGELQAAEAELDELLDAILEEEVAEGGDGSDDWQDDSERSDEAEHSEEAKSEDEDGQPVDAAEASEWKQWSAQSRKRRAAQLKQQQRQKRPASDGAKEEAAAVEQPPNFSQLSAATLPADVPRIVLELSAPAMLYMPCGWFHEVESLSEDVEPAAGGGEKGHLALNFWFIPPDRQDERQPYSQQQLWQERWRRQREQLEQQAASRSKQWQTNMVSSDSGTAGSYGRRRGGVIGRRGWRRCELSNLHAVSS